MPAPKSPPPPPHSQREIELQDQMLSLVDAVDDALDDLRRANEPIRAPELRRKFLTAGIERLQAALEAASVQAADRARDQSEGQ